LDDELVLVVVAEGEGPRREPDQEAEQEHPDQHGHDRRGSRRDVREQRADRFGQQELEASHYEAYPPRRSSRARRPSSSAITRRRILSTISRSCVAITTVVPARLIRYRSCMMPTEVSGSRFPVGSSQTRSGGWLTTARAIETRCCSPPDSSSGSEFILLESPTRFSTSGTFLRISARLSPCTLSAYATFSN